MKIILLLPELDIGGVERHVIDLAGQLAGRGHKLLVISAGGRMQGQLPAAVEHRLLPVHKKNPFTILACAAKIASWIKSEGWQVIHAHSRVPAWTANFASSWSGIPFIVTAHVDFGNKARWIYRPYRRAKKVICVSDAVQTGMKECFFDNTQVILNGLSEPEVCWQRPEGNETAFLFVGRLSDVKGLQDVLRALPEDGKWRLDVLGDGPMRRELEDLAAARWTGQRVFFHGYAEYEVCDSYMSKCSCLLFPSYKEGMPLTLARAAQIGTPVIASDIEPVAGMCATPERLLRAGDVPGWSEALRSFMDGSFSLPLWKAVPTLTEQVDAVEEIYRGLVNER